MWRVNVWCRKQNVWNGNDSQTGITHHLRFRLRSRIKMWNLSEILLTLKNSRSTFHLASLMLIDSHSFSIVKRSIQSAFKRNFQNGRIKFPIFLLCYHDGFGIPKKLLDISSYSSRSIVDLRVRRGKTASSQRWWWYTVLSIPIQSWIYDRWIFREAVIAIRTVICFTKLLRHLRDKETYEHTKKGLFWIDGFIEAQTRFNINSGLEYVKVIVLDSKYLCVSMIYA